MRTDFLLAAALVVAPTQQGPTPADADAEFARLEAVWNEAHLKGDAAALDRLWADNITVIVPRMVPFTKTASLSVFRTGGMKFDRYATSDIAVRHYEACVVVTGRLQRSRSMGERVMEDDWRFTKVYVRGPKGLQVVTYHASDAAR
jgi:uncharacterized protein DUF4440